MPLSTSDTRGVAELRQQQCASHIFDWCVVSSAVIHASEVTLWGSVPQTPTNFWFVVVLCSLDFELAAGSGIPVFSGIPVWPSLTTQ
jgi:hypothetical protein